VGTPESWGISGVICLVGSLTPFPAQRATPTEIGDKTLRLTSNLTCESARTISPMTSDFAVDMWGWNFAPIYRNAC